MGKIRIVFFSDVMKEDLDGVSNTLHQIIRRLPQNRMEIVVVTPHLPDAAIPGIEFISCPYLNVPSYKEYRIGLPRLKKSIRQRLDDFKPDIIHWTTPSFLGGYAVKYGRKNNTKITSIYHTHFPAYFPYYLPGWLGRKRTVRVVQYFFRWMFKSTHRIFAPSSYSFDYIQKYMAPSDQIRIWGRGIDQNKFNPSFKSKQFFEGYGIREDQFVILFVSRLVKEKETDTLIRIAKLLENSDETRLVVVGDGPDSERMRRLMPQTIFTGKLVGEELSRAYASSDIFLFPSLSETFGNVILEAMASGLPIVAANEGGPSDLVSHGQRGYLVPAKDEKAFVEGILKLYENPGLREEMRKRCLAYARSHDWDVLVEELVQEFEHLVN